ncbi:MAG: glycine--tRNA ligase [Candidatus Thorarchaeota archaeon]|nr:glycine--tRNA ligase [Candidatus Thorarchaeota archaeon]MCK5238227.1 glycine--tRNA ligase [Candidatus Thorarchaeota archaeon]
MASERDFNEVISGLAKKRGFYWGPSPEIYGGSSGFYDLGPLGKLLKNRLESVIRSSFVRSNFWEVECPTVSPEIVWKASGHLDGFMDPLTQCTKCDQVYRADNLIEEHSNDASLKGLSLDEMTKKIEELGIRCSACKSELGPVQQHNLMLKTKLGLDQDAYMRPETATTTYLLFKRFLTFFRDKLPASVFQIGKAYRNEISPRQGMLRLREFTQVEGQIFILEEDEMNWPQFEDIKDVELPLLAYQVQEKGNEKVSMVKMSEAVKKGYFQKPAYAWCVWLAYEIFRGMGFTNENMRLRQHLLNERAHYAADAWDVEIQTRSFGWVECCGIHDRGNYDLTRHQEFSKERMSVKVNKQPVVPNVLEIAFGVERPLFCLLDNSYAEDEERNWLKFPPPLAPVQVAIFPLMGKPELLTPAQEIFNAVLDSGLVTQFDRGGSIGRRYRRQDEVGTPFCVTVDYDSLEDSTVTVRDRDSMEQVRIKREELVETLHKLVKGTILFASLAK